MRQYFLIIAGVWLALIGAGALAQGLDGVQEHLQQRLDAARPGLQIESLEASPIGGLYRAVLTDGRVLYINGAGDHMMVGNMYEVRPGGFVNLDERRRSLERRRLLAQVRKQDMAIFAPRGEVRAVLHVFTDVTCPYCRRLHDQVGDLNDRGVEVRYLAWPRHGLDSEGYHKIQSAWCADDKLRALSMLKSGLDIDTPACDSQVVRQHFELGLRLGVDATPASVLPDGSLAKGLHDVPAIMRMLGLEDG